MDETSPFVTGAFRNEFANLNVIHPLAVGMFLAVLIAMAFVRRQYIPALLFFIAVFISTAQRVVIFGSDFSMLRILGIGGLTICYLRRDLLWIRLGWLDVLSVAAVVPPIICQGLLWGSFGATTRFVGLGIELVTIYFILRACIRSIEDLRITARMFGIIAIAAAPLFLLELSTGRNLFSAFGGVPEMTVMRDGALRCQGAFSHPILAGCFFAAMLPLWTAQLIRGRTSQRLLAGTAIAAGLSIVYASASSTPVMVAGLGFLAWIFYPVRAWIGYLFLAAGLGLFALHLAMKAPVWHLISRVDIVSGNTGYHRYALIDAAIEHFGSWWLIGTKETASWGPTLFDVTNQFILNGVLGGIWATAALVLQFALALFAVGAMLRLLRRPRGNGRMRADEGGRKANELLAFAFGIMIVVQIATFMSVTYFGQSVILWQLTVAVAASLRQSVSDTRSVAPKPHSPRRQPRGMPDAPVQVAAQGG